MTKEMCENFVSEINKMMSSGVDCVEFYSAKPGTKLYNGIYSNEYNSCIEDYIGYTDQFEWDKNISLDESMKQTREYSDFIGTVMDVEGYELWLGDTSEKFTDTHTQGTTVGVIILYKQERRLNMERTYYINGIQYDEQEFLQEMANAGAMVQDIVDLADGYSFVGDNGNMFDVEFLED